MKPLSSQTPASPFGRRDKCLTRFSVPWIAVGLLVLLWLAPRVWGAPPIFENRTPVGFSTADSTTKENFVLGQQVTVRADLNQAVTPTYPAIGHFHNLERSDKIESGDIDGLRADVAVSEEGTIHMAWIAQEVVSPVSTPAYYVRYARSEDGGKSFSSAVSVSGSLRFDILTLNGSGTSFSTVDLEVDSRGNPRVVYAFNFSADGHRAKFASNPDNVYLSYSENGGASWLPGSGPVLVNDTTTVGNGAQGRTSAFPRMVIDQRDNIFISYVRGTSKTGATDDIMLARVDRETTPFSMKSIGSLGAAGSNGGVRISADGSRQTGPDIDAGTGDVLHVVYFDDGTDRIEHKSMLADAWSQVGTSGWNQGNPGALIDGFDNEVANAALETDALYYFPTVAVDKQSSPDRIYALYKFGGTISATVYETIFFNSYVYDNATGGSAGWSDAQAAAVWSTATSPVFTNGSGKYNIELEWTVTEPVSAVVDERRPDRGELHIAFSAGNSSGSGEHDIYYGYYNGASWTLPEKVADDDAGLSDGIDAADVYLSAPVLAQYAGSPNVYLAFAAGIGEGLGVDGVTNVNQHAYFKVLGRAISSEDESVPVGGFQYDLSYTPINPQSLSSEIQNNLIYLHAADNSDGSGLGATGLRSTDGFLTGDWERIGTTLADSDKFFEGRNNDATDPSPEWGDEGDKIGLLLKLNVLGSDSSTNLQVITASSATGPSVAVATDPSGSFVVIGDFFMLGADVDIVDSNTAPVVSLTEPNGVGDEASLAYAIQYSLTDADDDISTGALKAALYYAPDSTLASVQDIRIFGTLIVDENDNSTVFASGTDDFAEGRNQTYTWDNPSAALQAKLFASIQKAISRDYYIYLVADDQKNPPTFTRSPGPVTIKHKPIVDLVSPATTDTVDTGVRTGSKASPYDLDFRVRDFDRHGGTQVQLFYASVSGLNSVSASGTFPNLKFVLGKSVAGVRGVPITHADTLTSVDTEFSWDLTDSVAVRVGAVVDSQIVAEGSYYLYAVASDSVDVVVGQSVAALIVRHSPSFTFYEPAKDTHRKINTGSQPIYTIQWQKGPGDADFDDNANIDLYFTSDNPATVNYENYPDSLLADGDTRFLVRGLTENGEGAADMYTWDFRSPPFDVPGSNTKVWLYAVVTDAHDNRTVSLGGALTMTHDPYIMLLSSKLDEYASFQVNDVLRIAWDDYLIDDGVSTDDAYIRIYSSNQAPATFSSLQDLETAVGLSNAFLINSSDGTLNGTIRTVREDSSNFIDWDTKKFGPGATPATYYIYAAISKDPTFNNNTATTFAYSSEVLTINGTGATPNISLSPTDLIVAESDTVTLDVMVHYSSPINLVQVVLKLGDDSFYVVNQSAPFTDLNEVFPGTAPIENTYKSSAKQLRFVKSTFQGQVVGSTTSPARLARFQMVPTKDLVASPSVIFSTGETGTVVGMVGKADPVEHGELGFSVGDPLFKEVIRGTVEAKVELEGRTLGDNDHTTLLEVHLRLPGSTVDISDSLFTKNNDDRTASADTVEVTTNITGDLTLTDVPPGRYVLTVKDTSHVSGRSDTFTVRNGETVQINTGAAGTEIGFYGSDLRGDPTMLLAGTQSGRQLIAGDVSGDNEINEDDVNEIIAAWGTGSTAVPFLRADINNDDAVGAPDLTLTTSNFGNSEGFGAPPVYKRAVAGDNGATVLELQPLFDGRQPIWPGQEIEFEVQVRDLDDLAGYEFDVAFDPSGLRLVPNGVKDGGIFADNPLGSVFENRYREGELSLIGSRIGKVWSAREDGVLARLRFEVLAESGIESIQTGEGLLLTSSYQKQEVRWSRSLAELLLPTGPELEQNYPNPFNPTTAIRFALPLPTAVRLDVYDILGQRIRTLASGPMEAGYYTLLWNGRDALGRRAGAGVYFYLLQAGEFRQSRKMTLVK